MSLPNLAFLGFGLWMIGSGWPGFKSVPGVLKISGGVLVILYSFGVGA